MKNEVCELERYFNPFGYLDLEAACYIWEQVGLSERDLFEIIDDTRFSLGYENFENIDPVASVLEHILQMARNHINELAWYDFRNDFSGSGNEIYTHSNYMCSTYDYSTEAIEELSSAIWDSLNDLMQDKRCRYFLKELEIGAN